MLAGQGGRPCTLLCCTWLQGFIPADLDVSKSQALPLSSWVTPPCRRVGMNEVTMEAMRERIIGAVSPYVEIESPDLVEVCWGGVGWGLGGGAGGWPACGLGVGGCAGGGLWAGGWEVCWVLGVGRWAGRRLRLCGHPLPSSSPLRDRLLLLLLHDQGSKVFAWHRAAVRDQLQGQSRAQRTRSWRDAKQPELHVCVLDAAAGRASASTAAAWAHANLPPALMPALLPALAWPQVAVTTDVDLGAIYSGEPQRESISGF